MDLSFLEVFIPNIAKMLNLDPATVLLFLTGFVTICNLVGRAIPDDAIGALGVIRRICKFLGLYAPNRITSGVSTSDVASAVIHGQVNRIVDSANDTIEEISDSVTKIVPAFPGLDKGPGRDLTTGQFVSKILKDSDDAAR